HTLRLGLFLAGKAQPIAPSSLLGTHAGHLRPKLHNRAVVNDAVNGGGRGEGIFEDLVPFGEDEIGGDHHTTALIPFGQEGKEHLHFLSALLDVTNVVEDHYLETVEPA